MTGTKAAGKLRTLIGRRDLERRVRQLAVELGRDLGDRPDSDPLLAVGVPLIEKGTGIARFFGFIGIVLASVNIFGGFLVTQRMLGMYKKKG